MNKKKRLLEIIYEIQELYPNLDRLMIDDVEDPVSIIITSEGRLEEIADQQGFSPEVIEEFFDDVMEDDDPFGTPTLIGYDDDDDDGGGILQ